MRRSISRAVPAIALLTALLLAPSGTAATQSQHLDDTTYYIVLAEPGAPAGLYEETNGCSGFQGESGDCDGDATQEPADERVDSYGEAWDLTVHATNHGWRLTVELVDEAWTLTVELVDLAWDYSECLIDYTWELSTGGDPAWCGLP